MGRPVFVAVVWLGAIWATLFVTPVRCANPDDIQFHIGFVRHSAAYHAGESIGVEISYASSAEKKYRATWTSPHLEFGSVTLRVTPANGVVDLRDLIRGYVGSFPSSEGYLSPIATVQELDLNDWYRFRNTGHYSLIATSTAVSRMKKAEEEGGGAEQLTLESNALEFDILPADASWSAAELAEVERIVDYSEDPQVRYPALHRLAILDTPGSVQKLVQLYLSQETQGDPSGSVYRGLNNSLQVELIIDLLKTSLSDPTRNPRGIGADLLAEFQVRKELGPWPKRPDDAEGQKEWEQKAAERNKAYERYFAANNELLLESIKRRNGLARVAALYEAWNNAERQNGGKAGAPEFLVRLRREVLALAPELELGQQVQFLYSEWPILPHQELLPTIEKLASNGREEASNLRDEGYTFWCRDWPRECGAAILAEATKPGTQISRTAILLMPEGEHPELDGILERRLLPRDSGNPPDWLLSRQTAALVVRAGSRKLLPAVDAYLDRIASYQGYDCEMQGYFIAYLFRFATVDATKRALQVTQSEKSPCGGDLFRMLHTVRYTDDELPVAETALASPNLITAGSAALFLGLHGADRAEAALWTQLGKLRESWSERREELSGVDVLTPENGVRGQTAQLEQELVCALANAANWKLTTGEREGLRDGCLTERCKDIVDGKRSFGF
jgi:hypothetical protein